MFWNARFLNFLISLLSGLLALREARPLSGESMRDSDDAKNEIEREKVDVEYQKVELQRLALVVDVWKKTVDVQQHFNDLALRIRNFALTLLVGVLGGTALALKDAPALISIHGYRLSLASALLLAGLIGWFGFWVLDRHWYHRLLVGAVKHGKEIESATKILPMGLTIAIEKESHIVVSKWYVKALILAGTAAILIAALAFATGVTPVTLPRKRYVVGVVAGALIAAFALRPLLVPKWTLKARNRINIFYALIGVVVLVLAYVLRNGITLTP
jgi:hypothetical protein